MLFEKRFTGRDKERRIFLEALKTPQAPNEYRLLTFYGVGGQGKSELSRYFQNLVRDHDGLNFSEWANKQGNSPEYHVAPLDFGFVESRDPAEALFKLRGALTLAGAKIDFFHFDLTFSYYLAKASPGVDMRQRYSVLFSDTHSLFYDLILFGTLVPEPTISVPSMIIGTLGKHLQNYKSRQRDWYNSEGKRLEAQLKLLDQQKLLEVLPKYLGKDLEVSFTSSDLPRLVFTFDTYEALWETKPQQIGLGSHAVDGWVRDLVSACPGALFIFFGRDSLKWDNFSKSHKRRNYTSMLESNQHRLDGLSKSDANLFLKAAGIWQPQIRRAIIASSAGLPFYLGLQLETYHEITDGVDVPTASDFGGHEGEVITNFLRHLNDHQESALHVLAQARQFDRELFEHLKSTFFNGSPVSFTRFIEHSFVRKQQGANQYVMHQLMREHLLDYLKREEPESYAKVHTFLFEHYDERAKVEDIKKISPVQEIALIEAAYHKSMVDKAGFAEWLYERIKVFYKSFSRQRLLEPLLLQAIEITEQVGGESHPSYAQCLDFLAGLLQNMARYDEAESRYRQVIQVVEQKLTKTHLKDAVDLLISACKGLAGVLRDKGGYGNYRESEWFIVQALRLVEQADGKEHQNYAVCLNDLAELYYLMGYYRKAEELFRRVIEIDEETLDERTIDENPIYAKHLSNLSVALRSTRDAERYEEAERVAHQAATITKKAFNEVHPRYATSLNNLALILHDRGRYEGTQARYEKAEIYYQKAETHYWDAIKIDKQTIGEAHPEYGIRLDNLAILLRDMNRCTEAEPLCRQAIEILSASLGVNHSHTQTARRNHQDILECLE